VKRGWGVVGRGDGKKPGKRARARSSAIKNRNERCARRRWRAAKTGQKNEM